MVCNVHNFDKNFICSEFVTFLIVNKNTVLITMNMNQNQKDIVSNSYQKQYFYFERL